jgi:hypothetical protein
MFKRSFALLSILVKPVCYWRHAVGQRFYI